MWKISLLLLFLRNSGVLCQNEQNHPLSGIRVGSNREILIPTHPRPCACGSLTSFSSDETSGAIKSPNYPSEYCGNLNCKWVIKQGPPDTAVRLKFDYFDTEQGPDWLEIFLILDNEEQKLYKLTGTKEFSNLPNFVFSQGTMELIFKTDGSVGRAGFYATFTRFNVTEENCACSPIITKVTKTPVQITSPNFPKPYCANLFCFFLLQATPPYGVQLTFNEFETKSRYDRLLIYDGNTTNTNALITTLQGTTLQKRVFKSKRHHLLLQFRTDAGSDSKGFNATVQAVDHPCNCVDALLSNPVNGSFTSPGFPEFYCDTLNCNYTVTVASNKILQLNFNRFQLHANDRLEILNPSDNAHPINVLRGMMLPTKFTADSNTLKLRMKTFPAFSGRSEGFSVSYKAISRRPSCRCGSQNPMVINETANSLQQTACGPLDCFYILQPPFPNATLLHIWVNWTLIKANSDKLIIYKDRFKLAAFPTPERTYTGRVANNSSPRLTIAAKNIPVMIRFHTAEEFAGPASGFQLYFKWFFRNCGCGERNIEAKEGKVGWLASPGFPVQYCNDLNCRWTIEAPAGFRVVLRVLAFNIESADHLGFYDGTNDQSLTNRIAILQGTGSGPSTFRGRDYRSNGTKLSIRFTTDASVIYSGWNITFYSESIYSTPSPFQCQVCYYYCSTTTPIPSNVTADELLMDQSVEARGLSFPVPYQWPFLAGMFTGLALGVILTLVMLYFLRRQKAPLLPSPVTQKRTTIPTYISNEMYDGNDSGIHNEPEII